MLMILKANIFEILFLILSQMENITIMLFYN